MPMRIGIGAQERREGDVRSFAARPAFVNGKRRRQPRRQAVIGPESVSGLRAASVCQ